MEHRTDYFDKDLGFHQFNRKENLSEGINGVKNNDVAI